MNDEETNESNDKDSKVNCDRFLLLLRFLTSSIERFILLLI